MGNSRAPRRVLNKNTLFANLEIFKVSIQHIKDDLNEFSRLNVNAVKTFEQATRDNTNSFPYVN
jgi:hypothetical protein